MSGATLRSLGLCLLCAAPVAAGQVPDQAPRAAVPQTPPPRRPQRIRPETFNLSVYGGTGLLVAASPRTLAPGTLAGGASVMNFDRNPGDIDFFEYSLQVALGLPGRTEAFVRFTPTLRNDAVGLDPLGYPIPPVDLFIDTYPAVAARPGPLFLFAQETPYKTYRVPDVHIRPPGKGAFASSTGDLSFGGKVNLLSEERHDPFGLGVRVGVDLPTEKPAYNTPDDSDWRKYAGFSGKPNVRFDLLLAKTIREADVLFNAGYKKVGDPDRGLRVQYVDSSRLDTQGFLVGAPVESRLDLHDFLIINGGASLPAFSILGHQAWLIAELGYTRYVGSGTPVERLVHPLEMRLGLQANFPWYQRVAVGMAWQLLFNNGGNGDLRRSTLVTPDGRGDINFSELVDTDLSAQVSAYFASRGATFSPHAGRVFATDNPAFDDWRNVPAAPGTIIAQGGGNLLAFITWQVGRLW